MSELRNKSIHELRGIAQSFGIPDIFEKDVVRLQQEIEIRQQKLIPPPAIPFPLPEYDARLMSKPPARRTNTDEIITLLEPYIAKGLKLSFDHEHWYMASGIKNDTGVIRMPLRHVLECARKVMA